MIIQFNKQCKYAFDEDEKIETPNSYIYRGIEQEFGRDVCIKAIHLQSSNIKEEINNINKEVKVMVKISQDIPFIPTVYDTFYDDKNKIYYIIMQWIKGNTLRDKMKSGLLRENDFINYMIRLCDILTVFEKYKMSHKDIKPENIMIDEFNNLYLIDFNITLSRINKIEGTENYRSPEVSGVYSSSDRSKVDMFAIGVMLYEYYAKHVPIFRKDYGRKSSRDENFTLINRAVKEEYKNHENKNKLIEKCMSLNPRHRYASCKELKRELNNLRKGK